MAVNLTVSRLLERYGALLSEKQQRILDGYYNCDLSLSEIAENEGMTRQGASDFVKRSEAQLTGFEEKLSLEAKSETLRAALEKKDYEKLAVLIENF